MADWEALDNFSDEFGVVAQVIRVLFQDGRTHPSLDDADACGHVDERRGVIVGRESRELQNAGVKAPPLSLNPTGRSG
jgi:hypothetical protein